MYHSFLQQPFQNLCPGSPWVLGRWARDGAPGKTLPGRITGVTQALWAPELHLLGEERPLPSEGKLKRSVHLPRHPFSSLPCSLGLGKLCSCRSDMLPFENNRQSQRGLLLESPASPSVVGHFRNATCVHTQLVFPPCSLLPRFPRWRTPL